MGWNVRARIPMLGLTAALVVASCSGIQEDDDSATIPGDDDSAPTGDDDDSPAPVDPFLDPEHLGPYLVGNTSIYLEDSTRDLGCGEGSRVLLTEIWYPAADGSDTAPENTTHDFFDDRWDEVVAAMGGGDGELIELPTGSFRDAPLHPDTPAIPITVFSHGYLSSRFQNFTMAAYLASHGYLVVAPDHACNTMVTLTPDQVIPGEQSDPMGALADRRDDVVMLMDTFVDDPPAFLAGRLDPARLVLWGHSWGGVTTLEVLKVDSRPQAVLPIAAFAFPPMPEDLAVASMFLWGQQDTVMGAFEDWHHEVYEQMPQPRHRLEFIDTGHFAFSDLCEFVPELATQNGCGTETAADGSGEFTNPDHTQLHAAMGAYSTAFFGAALFGYPELEAYLSTHPFPGLVEMDDGRCEKRARNGYDSPGRFER